MRDLLPDLMRRRQWVVRSLTTVFERFAYQPLDTPAMERAEVLLGKYGPDAERLIYRAGLRGEMDLAMRYDHSVPLARFCASQDALPRPFRRYQIGPVWRGERPQKGRYREFVQADVDAVGTAELLADAEILDIALAGMDALGVGACRLMLNHRLILAAIGRYAGVPESLLGGLYRAIDKRDALGRDGLRVELLAVGLPSELLHRQRQAVDRWLRGSAHAERLEADLLAALEPEDAATFGARAVPRFLGALAEAAAGESDPGAVERVVMADSVDFLRALAPDAALLSEPVVDRLLELLDIDGQPDAVLGELGQHLTDPTGRQGIDETRDVLEAVACTGRDVGRVDLDPAMVRGLEYYTGIIFEVVVPGAAVGSVASGGRYDNLVGTFGRDLPAVGMSFGVDRLLVAMDELALFPEAATSGHTQVLVTRFDDATTAAALRLAAALRDAGLRTEMVLDRDRLGDQIRHALRTSIPLVAIIGPDERARGDVTLRDLRTRSELTVPMLEVPSAVRRALGLAEPPGGDAPPAGDDGCPPS